MRTRTYRPFIYQRSFDIATATTVRASLFTSTSVNPLRLRSATSATEVWIEKAYAASGLDANIIVRITTGSTPYIDLRYPTTTMLKAASSGLVTPLTLTSENVRGQIWTNEGATGAMVVNLPAGIAGMHAMFVRVADYAYSIYQASGETCYIVNDTTYVGVKLEGVGSMVRAICVSTGIWVFEVTGLISLLS